MCVGVRAQGSLLAATAPQWVDHGYLVYFEGLISTAGKELGMLQVPEERRREAMGGSPTNYPYTKIMWLLFLLRQPGNRQKESLLPRRV